mmetsp:Transcript_7280/g.19819  ORF Transcript_7280/g.19819 Transcript_7280/m.19819 type:complete len:204 (+) Transcript_7280:19-630(+)
MNGSEHMNLLRAAAFLLFALSEAPAAQALRPAYGHLPSNRLSHACPVMAAAGATDKYAWTPLVNAADLKPKSVASAVAYNQEIAIIVDKSGSIYAVGNKAPPAGQPLTFSTPTDNLTIKDPVCGSEFDLQTGKVVPGTWLSSPLPGAILKLFLRDPEDLPTYPVRIKSGKVEAYVNQNAFKQYDDQYWKGILDAQGKADGGYY